MSTAAQIVIAERSPILEDLGLQIRSLRRERRITAAALADAARLSSGMLSKIENGKTSPSLATIQALAVALDTRFTSLFAMFEARAEKHAFASHCDASANLSR